MNVFVKITAFIALTLISIFVRLYVLTRLWDYIAVPLGAPHIGILTAFGVSLIVSWLAQDYREKPEMPASKLLSATANSILGSLIVWAIGYFIFT
jgi:hypothetical protein